MKKDNNNTNVNNLIIIFGIVFLGIFKLSLKVNLLEQKIIQPFIRIISATLRQKIS